MPASSPSSSSAPSRRSVVRTAAWAVPAVSVVSAAPAFAATGEPVACTVGAVVPISDRALTGPWSSASTAGDYLRWNEVNTPLTTRPTNIPDTGYQNVFTGWTDQSTVGDNSLIAAHDHTKGWEQGVRGPGFASGADNSTTAQVTFTATYFFPVAAGATYSLATTVYTNPNNPGSQHLAVTVSAPGTASTSLAKVTTARSWEQPPAGYEDSSNTTSFPKSTIVTPAVDGILEVSYTFTVEPVQRPYPTANYETNDDIAVTAPLLTAVTCPA
ncbi:MAG: hypothetical protein ACI379_00020 [Nocardioides sp.]|uniref:hypothetical protein n=1 Tax=Nocardioides sp. TaxID=35761 RepID=UPI003F0A6D87